MTLGYRVNYKPVWSIPHTLIYFACSSAFMNEDAATRGRLDRCSAYHLCEWQQSCWRHRRMNTCSSRREDISLNFPLRLDNHLTVSSVRETPVLSGRRAAKIVR